MPDPKLKLVIACVECGEVVHAPFDDSHLHSRDLFRKTGWVLSLVDPTEAALAPVCGPCAKKVFAPELLEHITKAWR